MKRPVTNIGSVTRPANCSSAVGFHKELSHMCNRFRFCGSSRYVVSTRKLVSSVIAFLADPRQHDLFPQGNLYHPLQAASHDLGTRFSKHHIVIWKAEFLARSNAFRTSVWILESFVLLRVLTPDVHVSLPFSDTRVAEIEGLSTGAKVLEQDILDPWSSHASRFQSPEEFTISPVGALNVKGFFPSDSCREHSFQETLFVLFQFTAWFSTCSPPDRLEGS